MESNICRICNNLKSISHFSIRKDSGRFRTECKECLSSLAREKRSVNKEAYLIKERERYTKRVAAGMLEAQKKRRKTDQGFVERKKISSKKYREGNAEKVKQSKQEAYYRDREKILVRQRELYQLNKEAIKKSVQEYAQRNKAKVSANKRAYKLRKKSATVVWADRKIIESFYSRAQRFEAWLGIEYHVDHIIPICSKMFVDFIMNLIYKLSLHTRI